MGCLRLTEGMVAPCTRTEAARQNATTEIDAAEREALEWPKEWAQEDMFKGGGIIERDDETPL